jgi:hypothetical protein|tara:strand:- start:888 stop:1073 length:186 start_codon:yes stop_codon:yes gene_type:complete
MADIASTKAPNISPPRNEYDVDQALLTSNQLRIYYNQLDTNNNAVKVAVEAVSTLHWLGDS